MLAGRGKKLRWLQCFQMARLVFHIWPFATMKSCPKASKCAKVCSKLCHLLNKALKCSNKNLPKKQNFAKSGHKYAKVGSERCHTLNKPSRNGQNVLKHSKRGKNSTIRPHWIARTRHLRKSRLIKDWLTELSLPSRTFRFEVPTLSRKLSEEHFPARFVPM